VPFDLPRSLSPSKVTSFRDCALAFRFNAIDHLPDEPTIWTVKGTLVHRALERLFWFHDRGRRTPAAATTELALAWDELQSDPDYLALALTPDLADELRTEAGVLVQNYFALEDPNEVTAIGVELSLEARIGLLRLRGIIDRLDLTADGELVVIDYKTGRAPSVAFEQSKLIGVHIYALLCNEVLGRTPVQVKLLHLKEPTTIIAEPSEPSSGPVRRRTSDPVPRRCATTAGSVPSAPPMAAIPTRRRRRWERPAAAPHDRGHPRRYQALGWRGWRGPRGFGSRRRRPIREWSG
jgi:putative RecB family exonuclease